VTAAVAEVLSTIERATRLDLPLGFAVKAYKGTTAMARPSTATVFPAVTGAGAAGANDLQLGIFAATVDNTAGTATTLPVTVDFVKEKTLLWRANDGTITAANLFSACYHVDNQTVSLTATNRAKAGTILAVDAVLGVAFEMGGI
jgi:hypothetical protein